MRSDRVKSPWGEGQAKGSRIVGSIPIYANKVLARSVDYKSIRIDDVYRLTGIEPEFRDTREQPPLMIFMNIVPTAAGIFNLDTPSIFHRPVPLADDSANLL